MKDGKVEIDINNYDEMIETIYNLRSLNRELTRKISGLNRLIDKTVNEAIEGRRHDIRYELVHLRDIAEVAGVDLDAVNKRINDLRDVEGYQE